MNTRPLRPISGLVWLIMLTGSTLSAASIASSRLFSTDPKDPGALVVPLLAGFFPVLIGIAASVASSILQVRRGRMRQLRGELRAGWGPRTISSFGWMLLAMAAAWIVAYAVWTLLDAATHSLDTAVVPRNIAVAFGLVFGPGVTGMVPAIMMSSSSTDVGNRPDATQTEH